MASACEVGECLRVHLNDVVRFLESGNHDRDTLDYTIFRLDWVLNVLARYLDTEGTGAINARVIDLVCEAREAVINADPGADLGGGCRGVRTPPPRDDLRFSNTTGILQKRIYVVYWC